ncbi:hypothetical protein BSAE_1674 [Bifidobacterium pullorum subsp. saeculare DSM 6531 = LMG 14934]|uniref:Uncharacterized protein n=1 Tax=Bifidobacterium pullorum subsp. saeculare DSM 6531 = LMG 14934 TaxID=1437611 RepID=A0A087CTG1_9BIFI|nr:hypothetical protein BSAE_1674 [Bifidobacterium pullorum subsp. saeculare DSM 6531 = LMG 14934]
MLANRVLKAATLLFIHTMNVDVLKTRLPNLAHATRREDDAFR